MPGHRITDQPGETVCKWTFVKPTRGLTASQTWRYDRQDYQGATGMAHEQFRSPQKTANAPPTYSGLKRLAAPVIFYMDGLGIRPTLFEMGHRLANGGYIVLLPDMFYRSGRSAADPKKIFATGDVMGAIGHLFNSTDNRRAPRIQRPFWPIWTRATIWPGARSARRAIAWAEGFAHRRWRGATSGPGRGRRELSRRQSGDGFGVESAPAGAQDQRSRLRRGRGPGQVISAGDGRSSREGTE